MTVFSTASAWRAAVLAGACVLGAGAAQAQMPPMKGEGAMRWVCGGIGSDESAAMRSGMKTHPLSLLFARKDGAYLAEVAVTIQPDGGAAPLALRANGPICLVDLPAGKYTVQATVDGATLKEAVTVGTTPRTADFRF